MPTLKNIKIRGFRSIPKKGKCPHFKAWVERLEKLGAPERP